MIDALFNFAAFIVIGVPFVITFWLLFAKDEQQKKGFDYGRATCLHHPATCFDYCYGAIWSSFSPWIIADTVYLDFDLQGIQEALRATE